MNAKNIVKKLLPPFILDAMRLIKNSRSNYLYYFGDFKNWDSALEVSRKLSGDYSDQSILDKVAEATQAVRNGTAVYEQDSVLFYEDNVNYELMASLMYAHALDGYLNVVDLGGSLGSIYFRYRKFFENLNVFWHVVEQEHFVRYGQESVPEIDFQFRAENCFTPPPPINRMFFCCQVFFSTSIHHTISWRNC